MSAGKWMVLLLVAGVGAGVAAGGFMTGPMRHWAERFGQHDGARSSDLVSFEADGSDGYTARGHGDRHRRVYDDEQGYPLEGEGEDFAYAQRPDGPAFQHAPSPDQFGPDWRYGPPGWQADDEQESDGDAYVAPPPRQRSFAPTQQALPTRRSPASPPIDDAAAAAAARARAAADDVTAAEHATS